MAPDSTMANLISVLMKARDVAHMWHWKVKSFSLHMALGELYEGLGDFMDELMEMYTADHGLNLGENSASVITATAAAAAAGSYDDMNKHPGILMAMNAAAMDGGLSSLDSSLGFVPMSLSAASLPTSESFPSFLTPPSEPVVPVQQPLLVASAYGAAPSVKATMSTKIASWTRSRRFRIQPSGIPTAITSETTPIPTMTTMV